MRLGFYILSVGVVLLMGGLLYFAYSWWEHYKLDDLNADAPNGIERDMQSLDTVYPLEKVDGELLKSIYEQDVSYAHHAARYVFYPGEWVPPSFWVDLLGVQGSELTAKPLLLKEFEMIQSVDDLRSIQATPPIHITIPAIQVDSPISELDILDLSDSRFYETPRNVVGYIPETGGLGEVGSAWFFGHLESPIKGEGSVFSKLPEIPSLWKRGVDVYAIIESEKARYLYLLTKSAVVHEDDLLIYQGEDSSINLVTCVPRFSYDHRQIITGELIGIKY